jgi:hypothetical protein
MLARSLQAEFAGNPGNAGIWISDFIVDAWISLLVSKAFATRRRMILAF